MTSPTAPADAGTNALYMQLNFGGNCEEAFRFYERHLGGKILSMIDATQMPGGAPPGARAGIIHARLALGGTVVVGNDVPPERFQKMRSAYLFYSVRSTEEAERVHALLADGGEVFMPLAQTFFAPRFSMLRDRFGVSWSIIQEGNAPM